MGHVSELASRRSFLRTALTATSATYLAGLAGAAVGALASQDRFRICAFEKFLQNVSYDELADIIAGLGFVGIEATVRANGHVVPERVEEDLPRLVDALGKRGLEITIMATDVRDANNALDQKVLKVAAGLGVKRYRMGNFQYDLARPIPVQLTELKPVFRELAALNRELGLTSLYQNHSGYNFVGATVWDLYQLIADLPVANMAVAFDIRHAAVEAGLSWEVLYRLVRPHIGAVYVKDYRWEGRGVANAPLGTSVDPKFFSLLLEDGYTGPVSLHVEYLPDAGTQANVDALRRDLEVLNGYLKT